MTWLRLDKHDTDRAIKSKDPTNIVLNALIERLKLQLPMV